MWSCGQAGMGYYLFYHARSVKRTCVQLLIGGGFSWLYTWRPHRPKILLQHAYHKYMPFQVSILTSTRPSLFSFAVQGRPYHLYVHPDQCIDNMRFASQAPNTSTPPRNADRRKYPRSVVVDPKDISAAATKNFCPIPKSHENNVIVHFPYCVVVSFAARSFFVPRLPPSNPYVRT